MNIFQENDLPAGLYLVATPIGNLRDISLRALDVLASVSMVFCEDSRISGKLLKAYGLKNKLAVYNDHSDEAQRAGVIKLIESGQAVALISDAGMPLISDPGYKLVRDCVARGIMVTSVPGANAPLSAIQLSGLPSDKFSFLGFLPARHEARRKILGEWQAVPGTLAFFESGPRLLESLRDVLDVLGNREAAVVREITKMHEEARRGRLEELVAFYEEGGAPRGEIVVVVAPPVAAVWDEEALDEALRGALVSMRVKEAAAFVAEKSGAAKKKLYDRAVILSRGDNETQD